MSYVTVIGNGESRKNIDLYELQWLGQTVGTNAVHRDFHPDKRYRKNNNSKNCCKILKLSKWNRKFM